eukprot:EG_transcript_30111
MSPIAGLARVPHMIVFDLDDCLWHPEMHELARPPAEAVVGDLGGGQQGVVGLRAGRDVVRLHSGALIALQQLCTDPLLQSVIVAAASTSLEPTYAHSCLDGLEILPGTTVGSRFAHRMIGRSGRLTARKTSHFRELHREAGVPYEEMLFFDDCNWGDHCRDVAEAYGVVTQRTPAGLIEKDWYAGLQKFANARCSS